MSNIWIDGFDELPDTNPGTYMTSSGYLNVSGISFLVGRAERGRACRINSGGYATKYLGGALTEVFCGFGFKYDGTLAYQNVVEWSNTDGTQKLTIQRGPTNEWRLLKNGVAVASTVGELIDENVWDYWEFRVQISGATSLVRIKKNRVAVHDFTVDATGFTIDRITLYGGGIFHAFDDYYINSTAGGTNNGFWGDITVENVPLTGTGDSLQFDPYGSTSNWRNVNNTGPAEDDQFNVGFAVGETDLFQIQDLSEIADTVYAVMIGVRTKKYGTGVSEVSALARLAGTTYISGAVAPDADYRTVFFPLDQKPGGGVWTRDDFNALQIGYRITG